MNTNNSNKQQKNIQGELNLDNDISSHEMFKELYDDLFETYQVVFEHVRKVDLLIKNQKEKGDKD